MATDRTGEHSDEHYLAQSPIGSNEITLDSEQQAIVDTLKQACYLTAFWTSVLKYAAGGSGPRC
jgi:hypothetical protein